jgi:hypothetical protein
VPEKVEPFAAFNAPVDEVPDISLAALDAILTEQLSPPVGGRAFEEPFLDDPPPPRPRRRPAARKRRGARSADTSVH